MHFSHVPSMIADTFDAEMLGSMTPCCGCAEWARLAFVSSLPMTLQKQLPLKLQQLFVLAFAYAECIVL